MTRVLLVDLNNFSMYPTIAVGYLAAVLRNADVDVHVLSPLAFGVGGVMREPPETRARSLARRSNYLLHQAPGRLARTTRRAIDRSRLKLAQRSYPDVGELFAGTDPKDYDLVLVSAYLMYYPVCEEIGRLCARRKVPLLIGGSYFASQEVARSWLSIPGLTALIGGEVELELPALISEILEGGDPGRFPGVWLPCGGGGTRPPLVDLDQVPFPDYTDFPWQKYPSRIIPLITGRGCGWGACTFCSDVTSTAGRSYRSRSAENVLDEAEMQSRVHETSQFVFTDLKLNSNLTMLDALASTLPQRIEAPRWIASVHVGSAQPNGLDRDTLRLLSAAGAARLTTGLESGSQRVLDRLAKGADLQTTSRFLWDASKSDISVRVTMIHGSPGETPEDVHETARFLTAHEDAIDRVSLNRFQAMIGPTFLRRYDEDPARYPSVIARERVPRMAYLETDMSGTSTLAYHKATQSLLGAVHRINRKPLPAAARVFDGVM